MTLYVATSSNVCFCTTCGNGETRKSHFFSLKCCISALPEFNLSVLDFFSLFDLRLTLTLLYDSLNLVISALSSGLLGGVCMVQEKGIESREPQQLDLLHVQCMCTNTLSF